MSNSRIRPSSIAALTIGAAGLTYSAWLAGAYLDDREAARRISSALSLRWEQSRKEVRRLAWKTDLLAAGMHRDIMRGYIKELIKLRDTSSSLGTFNGQAELGASIDSAIECCESFIAEISGVGHFDEIPTSSGETLDATSVELYRRMSAVQAAIDNIGQ